MGIKGKIPIKEIRGEEPCGFDMEDCLSEFVVLTLNPCCMFEQVRGHYTSHCQAQCHPLLTPKCRAVAENCAVLPEK